MTTGSIIWLLAIGVMIYFMTKNGGSCCGGHDHKNGHGSHGGNQDDLATKTGEGDHRTGRHEMYRLEDTGMNREMVENDPVCGMPVDGKDSLAASEYMGRTFRFCSERCKKLFELNPNKYATNHQ